MSERRISPAEQEASWDGHSFWDDCPPTIEIAEIRRSCALGCLTLPVSLPLAIVETARESRMERRAYNQIQEFLDLIPELPIKKHSSGNIFNPKDYPLGTILRIAETAETLRKNLSQEKYWGVIVHDDKKNDIVIAYHEEAFSRKDHLVFATHIQGEQEVGKIRHFRSNLESLRRHDWFEIWQYGRGIRERTSKK